MTNRAMEAYDASGPVRDLVNTDCHGCGSSNVLTDKFRLKIYCGDCGMATPERGSFADSVEAWDDNRAVKP